MKRKVKCFIILLIVLLGPVFFFACGNNNGGDDNNQSTRYFVNYVWFHDNLNDVIDSKQILNGTVEIPDKDKTNKVGYEFKGWYFEPTFTTPFSLETIANDVEKNYVVYAKFDTIDYDIVYNLNGGTNDHSNITKYNIETNFNFIDPVKYGYNFVGWYNENNNKITNCLGRYGKLNLYAKWEPVRYNIRYVLSGGRNNASNPNTYTIEQTITLKEPSKDGYVFNGWYSDANFTNKIETISAGNTDDKVLYAKWLKIYNITYVLSGGKNSSDNPNSYTELDNVILTNPTKTNYTFLGWYSDSDFTTKVETIFAGTTGNLTLYAKWEKLPSIKFYNGNELICEIFTEKGHDIVFNKTIPTKNSTEQYHFTFDKWVTEKGGTVEDNLTNVIADRTVYASFKETLRQYDVRIYVVGNGTVDHEKVTAYYGTPIQKDGNKIIIGDVVVTATPDPMTVSKVFEFNSWIINYGPDVTMGTSVGAAFSSNTREYTISFITNGGIQIPSISAGYNSTLVDYLNNLKPEKDNCVFNGWYLDENFTRLINANDCILGDTNVYIKWAEKYSITYHLNGGENDASNPTFYSEISSFSFKNATMQDNEFCGWYLDENCTNKITEIKYGTKNKGNIDLYAKWLKDSEGNIVIYDANDFNSYLHNSKYKTSFNFVLANDIDLTGMKWESVALKGVSFDGKGHYIRNININSRIFGWNENATIKNVNVENYTSIGGFIAGVKNCNVINCSVINMNIKASGTSGGLIDYVDDGEDGNSFISNCYTTGTINGYTAAGGLIGHISSTYARIVNCYSLVNITCSEESPHTGCAGGIIGSIDDVEKNKTKSNVVIIECYYNGNVGLNGLYTRGGGIVGYSFSSTLISDCVVLGSIKQLISQKSTSLGPIIGYESSDITVKNCYYSSDVLITTIANGTETTYKFYSDATELNRLSLLEKLYTSWDFNVWSLSQTELPSLKEYKESYHITNQAGFMALQNRTLTGNYTLSASIDFQNATISPININAVFDGNFYRLYNFKIASANGSAGLFTTITNYTIKNLTLENVTITTEVTTDDTYIGIVSAIVPKKSLIENVNVSGTITVTSTKDTSLYPKIGGFVGMVTGGSTITKSGASVTITISNIFSPTVGGFVGSISSLSRISNASSDGSILADNTRILVCGGFVGIAYGYVDNCYSTSNVKTTSDYGNKTAGFIGEARAVINNCYSTGTVEATAIQGEDNDNWIYTSKVYVGGFVAYSEYGKISYCYSTSDVTVNANGAEKVYVGGFAGYLNGTNMGSGTYSELICFYSSGNVSVTVTDSTKHTAGTSGVSPCVGGREILYSSLKGGYSYSGVVVTTNIEHYSATYATEETLENIWQNLCSANWDSEIWNIYTDKHPTLK